MPYPYPTRQIRVLGPQAPRPLSTARGIRSVLSRNTPTALAESVPSSPSRLGEKKKAGISGTPAFGHAPEGSY